MAANRSKIDINSRFGRLRVLCRAGSTKFKEVTWLCLCDCGKQSIVKGKSLRSGTTKSCGCINREKTSQRLKTHGMRYSAEYYIWRSMKDRCENERHKEYARYGGRGISVCHEWRDSFSSFYRDMGPRPHGLTLDRIDNDDGYNKGNCRWADRKTQTENRSNSIKVDLNAIAKTLGITYGAAYQRLKRGQICEKLLKLHPRLIG